MNIIPYTLMVIAMSQKSINLLIFLATKSTPVQDSLCRLPSLRAVGTYIMCIIYIYIYIYIYVYTHIHILVVIMCYYYHYIWGHMVMVAPPMADLLRLRGEDDVHAQQVLQRNRQPRLDALDLASCCGRVRATGMHKSTHTHIIHTISVQLYICIVIAMLLQRYSLS